MTLATLFCVGKFVTTSLEAARGYAEVISGVSGKAVEIKQASVVIENAESIETIQPGDKMKGGDL